METMDVDVDERRGSVPLDPADARRPRWLSRAEVLSRPHHPPKSDVGGFMRVVYEGLRASSCEQGLVFVRVGQSDPVYSMGAEHLITVLEGALEFAFQDQRIAVERLGQIFVPAHVQYQYRNVGPVDAWFHNVICRADEWPYSPPEYVL